MSPHGKNRTRQRGDPRNPRSEHHPESPTCTQGLGHCSEPIWLSGSMRQVLVTILLSEMLVFIRPAVPQGGEPLSHSSS